MQFSPPSAPRTRGALRLPPMPALLGAALLAAQGPTPASPSRPDAASVIEVHPCRQLRADRTTAPERQLTWSGQWSTAHASWRDAVGPALGHRPESDGAREVALEELAIVSWNMQGGGGDIDSLIRDIRRGRVHGAPRPDFVLLVQEAVRTGGDVPERPVAGSKVGKRVAPGVQGRRRQSIDEVARRNGLHLFYVPSVRNGGAADPAEDRGNAILSSVPLDDLEAIELPLERERRVAVAARIRTRSAAGDPVAVQLVNLHLDLRSSWGRVHRSLGAARAEQARSTVERFTGDSVVVVGGDLNTWFRGHREDAVRILREAFPHADTVTTTRTLSTPAFLPDLTLDHLFFRLPGGMSATHAVLGDRYGSDHYPVAAQLRPRALR